MPKLADLITKAVLLSLGTVSHGLLSCRDPHAGYVDWWVAIKFPGGDAFGYIDSNTKQDVSGMLGWTLGYDLASVTAGPLANSLNQLYKHEAGVGYMMWNDEFPDGTPSAWETAAHAKGVLGFDATSGLYLMHSLPKFPAAPCLDCADGIGNGSYTGIALGQQVYGQSFLCVTMAPSQLDDMAQIVGSEGVWVYDHSLPLQLLLTYPNMALLSASPYGTPALVPGAALTVSGQGVVSAAGQQFVAFAKSPTSLYLPLYEKVVQPFFGSGMLWETWQNGAGNSPQHCPTPDQPFFSFTVASLVVPEGAGWYVNRDHSKWGVTSEITPACCSSQANNQLIKSGPKTLCFGDMNRQEHQGYRGGGALCFVANDALWLTWSSLIHSIRNCTQPEVRLQGAAVL